MRRPGRASLFGDANLARDLLDRGITLAVEVADLHGKVAVLGCEPDLDAFRAGAPHLLHGERTHDAERRLYALLAEHLDVEGVEACPGGNRQPVAAGRRRRAGALACRAVAQAPRLPVEAGLRGLGPSAAGAARHEGGGLEAVARDGPAAEGTQPLRPEDVHDAGRLGLVREHVAFRIELPRLHRLAHAE